MKTGSRDENIDFCGNLTKFTKLSRFDKRKIAFLRQNYLEPIYHNKHSVSDGKKWRNLRFLVKFFQKNLHFLTNEKKNGSQKPQNFFGKTS